MNVHESRRFQLTTLYNVHNHFGILARVLRVRSQLYFNRDRAAMRGSLSTAGSVVAGLVVAAVIVAGVTGYRTGFFGGPEQATRAALETHCMDCHNPADQSGGLVLDAAALTDVGAHLEIWEKVARKVADRAMPPPDQPRPGEDEYLHIQSYLESELDAVALASPNAGSRPQLHRLTRTEYTNAIRDLLALENLPAELDFELLLPADNSSSGFDNIAELLFVSPGVMERYIDAARKISRLAVGDISAPPLVNRHRTPLQQPQDEHAPGLPIGTRGGFAARTYFPLDGEYLFTVDFAGRFRDPHELEVLIDGRRMARGTLAPGTREFGQPASMEFRLPATAGPAEIGVAFIERSQAFDESIRRTRRRSRGALAAIELVTVAGPYNVTGPGNTPSRERIFSCRPGDGNDAREGGAGANVTAANGANSAASGSGNDSACATEILTALATRAYRRPITAVDLGDLMPFYQAGLAEGGFERGIQKALERLLISPQFLYRIEAAPETAMPGEAFAVTDLELASRLSFFLWSSLPDDELLDLAVAERLRDGNVLETQIARMLADPRSESLVTNFAAQWLFLRDVESKEPDLFLFLDYDKTLRDAYMRESTLFLDSIFRENRSVLDLLTANHTFINERLAEHYGIPNVEGSHFRRVTLPEGSPRAGLLGKGGILALTSYSTRTSPVLRGKYVLENLLASPPPPPPPDIPSLVTEDEADGAALSMREALARHRADPACATCHIQMDAIGFALENFDAAGQWRDWDAGAAIDAASELPDGTVIDGVEGLRAFLVNNPDRFVRAFTEKLLMYALGRNVQYYDAPAVRAIVREAADADYAFASIVAGIVRSVPFQMRMAERQAKTGIAGATQAESNL